MTTQLNDDDEIISNYGACPRQLEDAISGLSETDFNLKERADSWTIRQIIHHIVDGDDAWKLFIKQAIGHPNSEFFLDWYWQVPQDQLVERWNYQSRPIEPSLALFQANRAHIVQLLHHTPDGMKKQLLVRWPTEIGEQMMEVRWILKGQTQHVLEHIAEISRIREAHNV